MGKLRIRGVERLAVLAIAGVLLALPTAAQGADAYVDGDTGVDTGNCSDQNNPCLTIGYGITKATAGATVHVDDRSGVNAYTSPSGFFLGSGMSLVADDFDGVDEGSMAEPDTIIDAGDFAVGYPSITVQATNPAGTIQGFVIRTVNNLRSVELQASATLIGNRFDEDGSATCHIRIMNADNNATIGPGNTFVDPTPTATPQTGVCISISATPTISSNTFTDLNHGIQSAGGNSAITENTFTGTQGTTSDAAIEVTAGSPTITGNQIASPGNSFVNGMILRQSGATPVGGTLRRNAILGHRFGLIVDDTGLAVDMNGDLIAGSTNAGLAMNDGGGSGEGNVVATNVTIADNAGQEVSINDAALIMNSSIVGATGITPSGAAPSCVINFSRGPAISAGSFGCSGFQTTAGPGFVNPAGDDYHLAAGSPLIDMGDPFPPTAGILDLDGGARATDGNGDGVVRRDIGADETATFVPPAGGQTPATGQTGQTGQRAAALKKCKKKRSKAKRRKCRKRAKRLPL